MYVEKAIKIYYYEIKVILFYYRFLCHNTSCTDKKPVSQEQGASVEQKDSMPVKKTDCVEVVKKKPLTYKILVPFAYRFVTPIH